MDTETIITATMQSVVERYASEDPKRRVSTVALRKVAERALKAYQAAPFPGRALVPWLSARMESFAKSVHGGAAETEDVDLLPPGHPARPRGEADPWAALESAEERLAALQKSVVESVTRAGVRKAEDHDLVQMNRRLSHVYEQHFSGLASAPTFAVSRQKVVAAAALVHEELERRGLLSAEEPFPRDVCKALYEDALHRRAEPEVTIYEGELLQVDQGLLISLAEATLHVRCGHADMSLEKLAERFTPTGSSFHPPFVEPHEVPYDRGFQHGEAVPIGKFTYTLGARTDEFTELFVAGVLKGVLVIGKESLLLRKSLVPYVLTSQAIVAKFLPPEGESALPPSLEGDVPPELRYWKSACGQDPAEVRKQLVDAEILTDESIRLVEGLPRRTYEKRFVAHQYPAAPNVFAEAVPEARPEAQLLQSYAACTVADAVANAEAILAKDVAPAALIALFDEAQAEAAATKLSAHAREVLKQKFLFGFPESPRTIEVAKQLGRPFTLPGAVGKVFVASHPVSSGVALEDLVPVDTTADQLDKRVVSLVGKSADEEERFVLGIVLEPETKDAQDDVYSEEEVRKSAHLFMGHFQNVGLMHKQLINEAVRVVESYLAPVDCEIGGQSVKKGTWLLGVVVEDQALWDAVKSGALSGFSIGGSAIRLPEA